MQTVPLRFPYEKPISDLSKDFLIRALTYDENKRISWAEVFQHKLVVASESRQV